MTIENIPSEYKWPVVTYLEKIYEKGYYVPAESSELLDVFFKLIKSISGPMRLLMY